MNVTWIVKTLPFEDGIRKDAVDTTIFANEVKMYLTILPEIQKLFQLSGYKKDIAPRLIYQSRDPVDVIILEDITQFGYETLDQHLTFEETKIVISRMAKFHAASLFMEYDVS